MCEHRLVQTSAVYLVGECQFPAVPPPSPPSPVTPGGRDVCTPIDRLSLDSSVGPDLDPEPHLTGHDDRLAEAVHVLSTEATALQCVSRLYAHDRVARESFNAAVTAIVRTQTGTQGRGKLVIMGVGKSGHIARKLVATFNSLALPSSYLHPTEVLHGDLGHVTPNDTLLFITASGKTPELLAILPYLDESLPLIVLTAQSWRETCELARLRGDAILLPAPVHEPETVSFGVAAPTTSTTVALAVGDALALVCAREWHGGGGCCCGGGGFAGVFAINHPG
ncbi:MAG: SIS domain-containing protein, partial [Thaumarchaeota archaeon]|nr:SIS domain-containing protein [Nitrososphaerota archaeon]